MEKSKQMPLVWDLNSRPWHEGGANHS